MHYLKGRFAFDAFTIIPFSKILYNVELKRLFYIIKILRISKGFYLLDDKKFKQSVKVYYQEKL